MPHTAIFPGSFDPIHNGHLDLIDRACRLFDRVVIAILVNDQKKPLFSAEERIEMLRELLADRPRCQVERFSGLLVDFARQAGAVAIVRGLRTAADFDYELPMTLMNRQMEPVLETLFLATKRELGFVSSRLLKEVVALGRSVDELVPPLVARALEQKLAPRT